ncbi:MAG: hypothetical protein ABIP55_11230 [Tepidisphaeraceae bacterium]
MTAALRMPVALGVLFYQGVGLALAQVVFKRRPLVQRFARHCDQASRLDPIEALRHE